MISSDDRPLFFYNLLLWVTQKQSTLFSDTVRQAPFRSHDISHFPFTDRVSSLPGDEKSLLQKEEVLSRGSDIFTVLYIIVMKRDFYPRYQAKVRDQQNASVTVSSGERGPLRLCGSQDLSERPAEQKHRAFAVTLQTELPGSLAFNTGDFLKDALVF